MLISSSSAYSYGHGYNTLSDSGTQSSYPTYIPMPSPSTYKSNDNSNSAYNTPTYNAYNTNAGSDL